MTCPELLQAERFLRAIPVDWPLPEVTTDPDGAISLDWIASLDRVFTVSVGQGNRLAFAWIDGEKSGCGVEVFDGQSTPQRILDGIAAAVRL